MSPEIVRVENRNRQQNAFGNNEHSEAPKMATKAASTYVNVAVSSPNGDGAVRSAFRSQIPVRKYVPKPHVSRWDKYQQTCTGTMSMDSVAKMPVIFSKALKSPESSFENTTTSESELHRHADLAQLNSAHINGKKRDSQILSSESVKTSTSVKV